MAVNALPTHFATPEQLVLQLKTLPPTPRILLKLQQLAGSDGSTVDELVALIRVERALAARIVQVANSPFYNHGTKCDTIEESVQRLGFKEVRQLAVTVAGCEMLNHPLVSYGMSPHLLWHHAVAGAVAAEHLAYLTGGDEPQAYTAGLMHGVGMIVIDRWMKIIAPGAVLTYANASAEWSAAERSSLGYDQAEAGAALLHTWEFPEPIVEAVRWQYATQGSTTHPRLTAILALSRWLANLVNRPSELISAAPDALASLTLRLSEQQLAACAPEVSRLLQKARQVFGAI